MLMEVTSGRLSATPDSTDRVLIAAKMLKADATDAHRAAFDKEMAIMTESDFRHPNVIGLVGICTQTEPFLILLEYVLTETPPKKICMLCVKEAKPGKKPRLPTPPKKKTQKMPFYHRHTWDMRL